MQEVPLDMRRLVRIWWAFTWRFILLNVAFGFGLMIVMLFGSLAFRLDPKALEQAKWMQGVFALLGLVAFFVVLGWVLALKWPDFRIALVRRSEDEK